MINTQTNPTMRTSEEINIELQPLLDQVEEMHKLSNWTKEMEAKESKLENYISLLLEERNEARCEEGPGWTLESSINY